METKEEVGSEVLEAAWSMVRSCWGGGREPRQGGASCEAEEQEEDAGRGTPALHAEMDGVSPKSDSSETPAETEGYGSVWNSHRMGFTRKEKEFRNPRASPTEQFSKH